MYLLLLSYIIIICFYASLLNRKTKGGQENAPRSFLYLWKMEVTSHLHLSDLYNFKAVAWVRYLTSRLDVSFDSTVFFFPTFVTSIILRT